MNSAVPALTPMPSQHSQEQLYSTSNNMANTYNRGNVSCVYIGALIWCWIIGLGKISSSFYCNILVKWKITCQVNEFLTVDLMGIIN